MDSPHPAVSVVIPAFNPGNFLRPTLLAIIDQTFTDWEAVVVDDGSSEDLTWVESLDPRISRLRQDNRGLSAARNRGIAQSTAPLIAFCDADDIWHPTKLERQVARLSAEPLVDLSHTSFNRIDESGNYLGAGFDTHFRDYEDLLHGCGICVSTVVIRRSALERVGNFDSGLVGAQDWDLWLRIAKQGQLFREEEVLADYRVHAGGMSRGYRLAAREWRIVVRRHASPTMRADLKRLRRLAGYQAFDQARVAFRNRDARMFATSMADSLMWAPGYTLRSVASKTTRHGAHD